MSETVATQRLDLLPNLGAEEGDDWRAYRTLPAVRSAARLWSLLFGSSAHLCVPDATGRPTRQSRDALWPVALGTAPQDAVFHWLPRDGGALAWVPTPTLERAHAEAGGNAWLGPPREIVEALHDKAFAVRAADQLGLTPRPLARLIEVLEPEALRQPDVLLARLDRTLASWPDWTRRRFTLKPRFGSSGRGRVGGQDRVDCAAVRGALDRLAARGGAIFEPWLERRGDFSVCVLVPDRAEETEAAGPPLPTLLGSLEMVATPGGGYRGHLGEVDSRGRIFSGDPADESLRADAAALASLARERGFFGPCGIDSFRYREPAGRGDAIPVDRLRSAVEFNARATMGLVAIGIVRRALSVVRAALDLEPGDRRGFALGYRDPADPEWRARLQAQLGTNCLLLDLSTPRLAAVDPVALRPVLAFTREPDRLRAARREIFGC